MVINTPLMYLGKKGTAKEYKLWKEESIFPVFIELWLNGLSHETEFFFEQKWLVVGLTKNFYWDSGFLRCVSDELLLWYFPSGPRIGFYKVRKLCRRWNNALIGIISSTNEPMGNKEGCEVVKQRTPIHRISPICFHLNHLESGKEDSLSEARLQS
jgi:hypothetical protein